MTSQQHNTSLILANVTTTLTRTPVDEATIEGYWRRYVLPGATDYLMATMCFGWRADRDQETWLPEFYKLLRRVRNDPGDEAAVLTLQREANPEHRHCLRLWLEDGDAGFYCLGLINRCVNCGAEWVGLVNVNWHTGQLIKGLCPNCLEPYEALTLQRSEWRNMVASTASDQIAQFDRKVAAVKVGLLFRLAGYYMDNARVGRILADREEAQQVLHAELKGKGFGNMDAYDAIRWAVWAEIGLDALGISRLDAAGWTSTVKRERIGALQKAARRFLSGDGFDRDEVQAILKRKAPEDAWKQIYDMAAKGPKREHPGEPNVKLRADAMMLRDPLQPDTEYILLRGDARTIARVRINIASELHVLGETEATVPMDWFPLPEDDEDEE